MSPTAKVSGDVASADMASADMVSDPARPVSCGKASPACYNRHARLRNMLNAQRVARKPGHRQEGGDTMIIRNYVTITAAAAALAIAGPVGAGGDKVAFPESHEAGVLFTTVDRADNKQFREVYTSAAALEAAKQGEPRASGRGTAMRQYAGRR